MEATTGGSGHAIVIDNHHTEVATYVGDTQYKGPTLSPYFIGSTPPMFAIIAIALVEAFGIFGNIIIIKVYLGSKQLRTPSNLFIVNLAVGDLVFLVSSSTTLNSMVMGGRMLYGIKGCTIAAIIIIVSATVTLMTMGLIAVSRFVAIVYPQKKAVLSWPLCSGLCVLSWTYGILLMIPTPLGYGRIGYHRAGWGCTYDWSFNLVYNIILFCASQVLTSIIMVFCYAKIYWVFRQSKKRVAGEGGAGKDKGPKKEEIRLAIQLLIVFAIYNICWGPYFILALLVDPLGQLPPWLYGAFITFVYWNSAVNILVYMHYNRVFRGQVFKTFGIKVSTEDSSVVTSQNTASTSVKGNG